MSEATLLQVPLIEKHRALGARFAPFAGWEMPVQYSGIVDEHKAVRERAGVFDVSHMGRLFVSGPDAARLLRSVVTYKVDQLEPGGSHYAFMCQEDGGILDDVFVYRIEPERFLLVNNAANVEMGRERVRSFVRPDMRVDVDDRQSETVMLALQGPEARSSAGRIIDSEDMRSLRRRRCTEVSFAGATLFVSRTGYTGEDGFEFVTTTEAGAELLDRVVAEGVQPCGLGARDTLRLEATLPLYGNDIDTKTTPFEAGLGFAVTFDDEKDFAGRQALLAARDVVTRKLSCLRATARGVMRVGYDVLHGNERVGTMTSGSFSPMLQTSIGLAYLPVELAEEGTELVVDVRGKPLPAVVVPRPFYRRPKASKRS